MTDSACDHYLHQTHFLSTCGYVTSTSNSYLVTCGNVDLDFLPLFPCHQEQLPILATVIGYSEVAGACVVPTSAAVCRCRLRGEPGCLTPSALWFDGMTSFPDV